MSRYELLDIAGHAKKLLKDVTIEKGLFLPPCEYCLDVYTFRELMYNLERFGYAKKKDEKIAIHRAVMQHFTQRLIDSISLNPNFDTNMFRKESDSVWLTWPDIRETLLYSEPAVIKLNVAERIMLTLEEGSSSWLATLWQSLSFCAIIGSVILIVAKSVPNFPLFLQTEMEDALAIFFSIEYGIKLVCSPFIRLAIFNPDWHMSVVVPNPSDSYQERMKLKTPLETTKYFVTRPMNVIDLASILPFWLTLVVGNVTHHVPLFFLRVLRLMRLFRVVKLGKFNTTLTVLGNTLTRSMQSAQVLVIWMLLTALIVGSVMCELEDSNPAFSTVPRGVWWVLVRILSVEKSAPFADAFPESWSGAILLSIVSALMKVLWILPLAMIKDNFSEEWKFQTDQQNRQNEVEQELQTEPGTDWKHDTRSFCARLEVIAVSGGKEEMFGHCVFALPCREGYATSSVLDVPIHHKATDFYRQKLVEIKLKVSWVPAKASEGKSQNPCGQLQVIIISASNLRHRDAGSKWRCILAVEQSAHHRLRWESPDATYDDGFAKWDAECIVDVDWEEGTDARVKSNTPVASDRNTLLAKIEEQQTLIREHSKQLEILQKMLQ